MIEGFEGSIGGGKTYSATERILHYLGHGGRVFTNIEVYPDKCAEFVLERFKWRMGSDQLVLLDEQVEAVEKHRKRGDGTWEDFTGYECVRPEVSAFHRYTSGGTPEKPSLVVIDEAHLFLNAQSWKERGVHVDEMLLFLSQSRKAHTDVIFISQSMDNVSSQVRRLVEYWWRFRDMRRWRIPLLCNYPFPQVMQIQFDYDRRTELQRRLVLWDKAIFGCYQTYQLVREFERKDEGDVELGERVKVRTEWGDVVGWLALAGVIGAGCV